MENQTKKATRAKRYGRFRGAALAYEAWVVLVSTWVACTSIPSPDWAVSGFEGASLRVSWSFTASGSFRIGSFIVSFRIGSFRMSRSFSWAFTSPRSCCTICPATSSKLGTFSGLSSFPGFDSPGLFFGVSSSGTGSLSAPKSGSPLSGTHSFTKPSLGLAASVTWIVPCKEPSMSLFGLPTAPKRERGSAVSVGPSVERRADPNPCCLEIMDSVSPTMHIPDTVKDVALVTVTVDARHTLPHTVTVKVVLVGQYVEKSV